MKLPRRTQTQHNLSDQLSRHPDAVTKSYLGALYALQQAEYPDKFVHFAQSVREVIDQLARDNRMEKCKKLQGKDARKECLQRTFDPLGQNWYPESLFDVLAGRYADLSKVAHHDEDMDDKRARDVLSEIENVLDQLTVEPLAINAKIKALVEKPPSLDSAKKIVDLQRLPATQFYLIDKMGDEWLPYMRKAGFFENPPPRSKDRKSWDGSHWAPSLYLKKCVKAFGEDVADIILSCEFEHKDQRNPIVYTNLLACATLLTTANMEKVARKALQEKWDDFLEWLVFGSKYVAVAEKLYLGGRYSVSTRMLLRALKLKLSEPRLPTVNADGTVTKLRQLTAPIGAYEWEDALSKTPALARKNPIRVIKLLDRVLCKSIALDNKSWGRAKGSDDGWIWRPAIEDSAQNYAVTMQSMLLSRLRDCVVYAVQNGEGKEAMKVLHRRDYTIYRRLEMHVYAEFPGKFAREVSLSALWSFGLPGAYHEHYRLLKTRFPALPDATRQKITERIDEGYGPDLFESVKRRHGKAQAKGAEKLWKLRYLESIKDHLDPKHKRVYENLKKKIGEPEHPDYGSHVTIRDTAPDDATFEGKAPDKVFETVKKHKPPESLADTDDVAESFGRYVKNNPSECSQRAPLLGSASPRIQYELFSGLSDAVKKGESIEWDGVLSLIKAILARWADDQNRAARDSPDVQASGARWPGQSVTEYLYDPLLLLFWLVEEGLKNDSLDFGLKSRVWRVVKEIVKVGDKSAGRDEYFSAGHESRIRPSATGSKADPQKTAAADEPAGRQDLDSSLTRSLNSLNGVSFHILYHYSMWCRKHAGGETLDGDAKEIFDKYLSKRESHTVSRHAVLGVFLPGFDHADPGWAKSLPGKVRAPEKARVAFWEGYVFGKRMHLYMFDGLYKWYGEFMNGNIAAKPSLARIRESTIVHVMLAYFYNLEKADGIVESFLKKRDPEATELCVRQIGSIIRGKASDSEFDKEKLVRLWREGAFKEQDLGMWFIHSPLSKKDAIRLYRNHMEQYQGKIHMAYDPVYSLAEYVGDFPADVAKCLKKLIHRYDYVPEKFRDVLAELCKSEDPSVADECVGIVREAARRSLYWEDLLPKDRR